MSSSRRPRGPGRDRLPPLSIVGGPLAGRVNAWELAEGLHASANLAGILGVDVDNVRSAALCSIALFKDQHLPMFSPCGCGMALDEARTLQIWTCAELEHACALESSARAFAADLGVPISHAE